MNNNLILTASVLIVISVGVLSLYVINDWYLFENDKEVIYNPIFSEYINLFEKKIYLIGGSQIGRTNHNFITNYLLNHGYDYYVYKLAIPGTILSDRISMIDHLIKTEPDIVILTTDIHDFVDLKRITDPGNQLIKKPKNIIFDPQTIISKNVNSYEFFWFDLNNFKNPKLTTLNILQQLLDEGKIKTVKHHRATSPLALNITGNLLSDIEYPEISKPDFNRTAPIDVNPFMYEYPEQILTYEEVEYVANKRPFVGGVSLEDNRNFDTIKKTFEKLEENNIHVILIINPRPQQYIDTVPSEELEKIQYLIEKLNNETGLEAYSLLEEYADLELWGDSLHVTAHRKGLILSEDIAKIIIKELEV